MKTTKEKITIDIEHIYDKWNKVAYHNETTVKYKDKYYRIVVDEVEGAEKI